MSDTSDSIRTGPSTATYENPIEVLALAFPSYGFKKEKKFKPQRFPEWLKPRGGKRWSSFEERVRNRRKHKGKN